MVARETLLNVANSINKLQELNVAKFAVASQGDNVIIQVLNKDGINTNPADVLNVLAQMPFNRHDLEKIHFESVTEPGPNLKYVVNFPVTNWDRLQAKWDEQDKIRLGSAHLKTLSHKRQPEHWQTLLPRQDSFLNEVKEYVVDNVQRGFTSLKNLVPTGRLRFGFPFL